VKAYRLTGKAAKRFARLHRALHGLATSALWNFLRDAGEAVERDDGTFVLTLPASDWYHSNRRLMEGRQ